MPNSYFLERLPSVELPDGLGCVASVIGLIESAGMRAAVSVNAFLNETSTVASTLVPVSAAEPSRLAYL